MPATTAPPYRVSANYPLPKWVLTRSGCPNPGLIAIAQEPPFRLPPSYAVPAWILEGRDDERCVVPCNRCGLEKAFTFEAIKFPPGGGLLCDECADIYPFHEEDARRLKSTAAIQLPGILDFLRGRHVTVFGSAPGRKPPAGYEERLIVCVNGSAQGLARAPDLLVLGAGISLATHKTCRSTLRGLANTVCDRVLFTHPGNVPDYEERFRDFGFSWGASEALTAEQRHALVEQIAGIRMPELYGKGVCSNGAVAAILAAAAGASRIDLCGFSFQAGHFYIDAQTPRHHVEYDRAAFEWLAKNAVVGSTDDEMRELFGFLPVASP